MLLLLLLAIVPLPQWADVIQATWCMLSCPAPKEISMRYLISTVFFVAAALAYMFGVGPAFFGAPLLGSALLLLGLGLEISFWRRLRRAQSSSSSRAVTDR